MTVSVLQWNTWRDEDLDAIIGELHRFDADILCLQELTTCAGEASMMRPQRIAASLGYGLHYAQAHRWSDGAEWGIGNAVLSRFPLHSPRDVVIREAGGRDGGPERGRVYTEAIVETPAGPVTVGTTHLSYITGQVETEHKVEEARRLAAAVGPGPRRRILTGDLNATPDSRSVEILRRQMSDAGPDPGEPTWTTKPYRDGAFTADSLSWRLDYVFVSPDLRVLGSEILATDVSDHLPIRVRVAG